MFPSSTLSISTYWLNREINFHPILIFSYIFRCIFRDISIANKKSIEISTPLEFGETLNLFERGKERGETGIDLIDLSDRKEKKCMWGSIQHARRRSKNRKLSQPSPLYLTEFWSFSFLFNSVLLWLRYFWPSELNRTIHKWALVQYIRYIARRAIIEVIIIGELHRIRNYLLVGAIKCSNV